MGESYGAVTAWEFAANGQCAVVDDSIFKEVQSIAKAVVRKCRGCNVRAKIGGTGTRHIADGDALGANA